MDASTCLKEMIQAVLALPPRQQYAMICSLKERVDDLRQLIEALRYIRWIFKLFNGLQEKRRSSYCTPRLYLLKRLFARV